MTDREILTKAIAKAVKNGYTDWGVPRGFAVYSVIFSHDFAKAFWGEGESGWQQYVSYPFPNHARQRLLYEWQYHLQQLVLEENPLSYIARFLEKEDTAQ